MYERMQREFLEREKLRQEVANSPQAVRQEGQQTISSTGSNRSNNPIPPGANGTTRPPFPGSSESQRTIKISTSNGTSQKTTMSDSSSTSPPWYGSPPKPSLQNGTGESNPKFPQSGQDDMYARMRREQEARDKEKQKTVSTNGASIQETSAPPSPFFDPSTSTSTLQEDEIQKAETEMKRLEEERRKRANDERLANQDGGNEEQENLSLQDELNQKKEKARLEKMKELAMLQAKNMESSRQEELQQLALEQARYEQERRRKRESEKLRQEVQGRLLQEREETVSTELGGDFGEQRGKDKPRSDTAGIIDVEGMRLDDEGRVVPDDDEQTRRLRTEQERKRVTEEEQRVKAFERKRIEDEARFVAEQKVRLQQQQKQAMEAVLRRSEEEARKRAEEQRIKEERQRQDAEREKRRIEEEARKREMEKARKEEEKARKLEEQRKREEAERLAAEQILLEQQKAIAAAVTKADDSYRPSEEAWSNTPVMMEEVCGPSVVDYFAKETVDSGRNVVVYAGRSHSVPIRVSTPGSFVEFTIERKSYDFGFGILAILDQGPVFDVKVRKQMYWVFLLNFRFERKGEHDF
jgi:hypothetical protein